VGKEGFVYDPWREERFAAPMILLEAVGEHSGKNKV